MKIFITIFLTLVSLEALEYYSKAEPKELFNIKSSVNGEIIFVNDMLEGMDSNGSIVIKIDDKIDIADLKASKKKLGFLNSNIALKKQNLQNSKKVLSIDRENYNRVKNLSSYSTVQKDVKLLSMINSQNSYIATKSSLENLKTQKEDLKLKIITLQDRIDKKSIKVREGNYIYKIYPSVGDYVNPGSKLMDVYDVSKTLLVVYLSKDELVGLLKKSIYLDGVKTSYKISKIWQVADSVNISSYRVEILTDRSKIFSNLIKIEFK